MINGVFFEIVVKSTFNVAAALLGKELRPTRYVYCGGPSSDLPGFFLCAMHTAPTDYHGKTSSIRFIFLKCQFQVTFGKEILAKTLLRKWKRYLL